MSAFIELVSLRIVRLAALVLATALLLPAPPSFAIAQRVGDFELAVDAPWRMEPRFDAFVACDPSVGCDESAAYRYGAVPIQISIHDADLPDGFYSTQLQRIVTVYQRGEMDISGIVWLLVKESVGALLGSLEGLIAVFFDTGSVTATALRELERVNLEEFVELRIYEEFAGSYRLQRTYGINDLHEVELTDGYWEWDADQDRAETPFAPPERPAYGLCRVWDGDECSDFASLVGTSEWHATAMYDVTGSRSPGRDVRLRAELEVAIDLDGRRRRRVYDQYLSVHLGEAPLPRFDQGWVYGDLHYHSQGTDNDGESAYSYRGTLQAMSALGLDFAFATDHASNSPQIVSAEPKLSFEFVEPVFRGLRDMSPDRFAFGVELLNGANGANREVASYPRPTGAFGRPAVPQLFLGAEVDVIPEYATGEPPAYSPFSACSDVPGGLKALHHLTPFPSSYVCDSVTDEVAGGRHLIRDVQGPHDGDFLTSQFYARSHLLHLPTDPNRTDAFIPSNTSKYGGATRRLGEVLDLELGTHEKGYAFIAHPFGRPSGSEFGRVGPDLVPYSDAQLRDAFASPHVLGLQLWNENGQLKTSMRKGQAKDANGDFIPVENLGTWVHDQQHSRSIHLDLPNWDRMLLWGLDPAMTGPLSWLEPGEPRRVFLAGGSDAHGDLNFRREGYLIGTQSVNDTALGTPRNLLYAGQAEGDAIGNAFSGARPHSQQQIVRALQDGNFSVTDGPALRVAYDANGNGEIDDADVPMGDVAWPTSPCSLSLIVEWKSTPEFGPVERIDLDMGVFADQHDQGMVYTTWKPPFGDEETEQAEIGGATEWTDEASGATYVRSPQMLYWYDPTQTGLRVEPSPSEGFSGRRTVVVDPRDYPVAEAVSSCIEWGSMSGSVATLTQTTGSLEPTSMLTTSSRFMTASTSTLPSTGSGDEETVMAARRNGIDTGLDFEQGIEQPPTCTPDRDFVEPVTPDRLYFRARATNGLAPGTRTDCSDSQFLPPAGWQACSFWSYLRGECSYEEAFEPENWPVCVRRRAYSNPVWVNIPQAGNQVCLDTGLELELEVSTSDPAPEPTPPSTTISTRSFFSSGLTLFR